MSIPIDTLNIFLRKESKKELNIRLLEDNLFTHPTNPLLNILNQAQPPTPQLSAKELTTAKSYPEDTSVPLD
jgi:hypothetical protein